MNTASPKSVASQLLRMSSLPGYGQRDESEVMATREALRSAAVSDGHCEAIATEALRACKWFPSPAEIFALAAQVSNPDVIERDRQCPGCAGTGWQQAWELVTDTALRGGGQKRTTERIAKEQYASLRRQVNGTSQRVYEGVIRCRQCSYGQRVAELEKTA